jgi:hypothetical protein
LSILKGAVTVIQEIYNITSSLSLYISCITVTAPFDIDKEEAILYISCITVTALFDIDKEEVNTRNIQYNLFFVDIEGSGYSNTRNIQYNLFFVDIEGSGYSNTRNI